MDLSTNTGQAGFESDHNNDLGLIGRYRTIRVR